MKRVLAILIGLIAIAHVVPATPLACSGTCTVSGGITAAMPPVLEISDGSQVVWTSPDIGHVNADGLKPGGGCFIAPYGPGNPSPAVQFDIVAGTLTATMNGETTTCGNAVALPEGSFVLPYYCVVHPTMRGALVITP